MNVSKINYKASALGLTLRFTCSSVCVRAFVHPFIIVDKSILQTPVMSLQTPVMSDLGLHFCLGPFHGDYAQMV